MRWTNLKECPIKEYQLDITNCSLASLFSRRLSQLRVLDSKIGNVNTALLNVAVFNNTEIAVIEEMLFARILFRFYRVTVQRINKLRLSSPGEIIDSQLNNVSELGILRLNQGGKCSLHSF